jgi:hypothetical protein
MSIRASEVACRKAALIATSEHHFYLRARSMQDGRHFQISSQSPVWYWTLALLAVALQGTCRDNIWHTFAKVNMSTQQLNGSGATPRRNQGRVLFGSLLLTCCSGEDVLVTKHVRQVCTSYGQILHVRQCQCKPCTGGHIHGAPGAHYINSLGACMRTTEHLTNEEQAVTAVKTTCLCSMTDFRADCLCPPTAKLRVTWGGLQLRFISAAAE